MSLGSIRNLLFKFAATVTSGASSGPTRTRAELQAHGAGRAMTARTNRYRYLLPMSPDTLRRGTGFAVGSQLDR